MTATINYEERTLEGETVSVIGVQGGFMRPLLERIQRGEIDASFVITHRLRLEDAPSGYEMFLHKRDNCERAVLSA